MKIQAVQYLTTNYSLFDLTVIVIVITAILALGLRYFSESKNKVLRTQTNLSPIERSSGHASDLVLSPQITVVFQKDISDDEELTKEIADMYISNRQYYYAGKTPPLTGQILSEKDNDVFIKYDNIDFSTLDKVCI